MRRLSSAAVTAAVAAATLSGCSGAEFASMSPDLPEVHATPSPVAATVARENRTPAVQEPKATRRPSDLELGSHTAKHRAGPVAVVIDYWTAQPATSWHGQPATVDFAFRVAQAARETDIKISRMRVTADDAAVLLDDKGSFAVNPPFSYGSGFTTPRTEHRGMTIRLQADLLIETEPGSGEYIRQTVFDTLNLTLQGHAR